MQEFKKNGFPIVRMYDEYFEVKAIDFWDFRAFSYLDIQKIIYRNPRNSWYYQLFLTFNSFPRYVSAAEPYRLKIVRNNGGDWEYLCPPEPNSEFLELLKEIARRCDAELIIK